MLLPRGFQYAGVACGIKESGKPDLALIHAAAPAVAAGVYTQNVVFAAPVEVDRARTPSDQFRVVVVNSGNANACTGRRGLQDAQQMAAMSAERCGAAAEQALVMSTGVIGEFLPMDKITAGIRAAAESLGDGEDDFLAAADAILTTDNGRKIAARSLDLGAEVRLAAFAKGAGMIGPRMATMLAVVMTDAQLSPDDAQRVLADAVDQSFNCISVEGHMSTNDTVLLLASGAASGASGGPLEGARLAQFGEALTDTCIELAKKIPEDGEGASHLIQLDIEGCRDRRAALRIAETVASSALVKTAITGGDPNWGRIVSAAGYAGVPFDPNGVDLKINGTLIYRQGSPVEIDAAAVSRSIRENRATLIGLVFSEGDAAARFWTSDLTVEYVKFNSEYHT